MPDRLHSHNPVTEPNDTSYRPDIDGLRAVAVLSVVGFHAFPEWIKGGFVGVDIFFVISGFLISRIIFGGLEEGRFNYVEFYGRRIRRIFPALALVLLACLVIGLVISQAGELEQLGEHVAAGAGFVSNFILWKEAGYFDNAADTKPLLHLWSLGIEEQFYIVWPLLLGLVWRYTHAVLPVTLLIAATSFALNVYAVGSSPIAAFYSPLSRAWELMVGSILAFLTLRRPTRLPARPHAYALIGLMLIMLGIALVNKNREFPGYWALLPTIGACLLITAGPDAWANRAFLSQRLLVGIGLISYPLYLWHWPLLSFSHMINGEAPTVAVRAAIVIISLFLAWSTYRLLERPMRYGQQRRIKTAALCGMMILIGVGGYHVYAREGLSSFQRDPSFTYDWATGNRYNRCFIEALDGRAVSAAFLPECNGRDGTASAAPLVVLWGDSHAASLYPGLHRQSQLQGFGLAQFTAAGCPPVLDFEVENKKDCVEVNRYVWSKIAELRPHSVILAAHWSMYNGEEKWNKLDYEKLRVTLQQLRSQPVDNVVLIGHLPLFKSRQPKVGARTFRANAVDRTYKTFNPLAVETDKQLRTIAQQQNVAFVSPIDLLCNAEGCLISTSKEILRPLAWDNSHLTEDGSNLLIELAVQNHRLNLPHPSP